MCAVLFFALRSFYLFQKLGVQSCVYLLGPTVNKHYIYTDKVKGVNVLCAVKCEITPC